MIRKWKDILTLTLIFGLINKMHFHTHEMNLCYWTLLTCSTVCICESSSLCRHADPFGGDPFKESDPFKTTSEDFFKRPSKADPFTSSDPFSKSATLPVKVKQCSEKGVQNAGPYGQKKTLCDIKRYIMNWAGLTFYSECRLFLW